MDTLASLIEVVAEDTMVLGLLALCGIGLAGLVAASFVQARKDVRRRASAPAEGPAGVRMQPARAEARRSLDTLMTYVETNFASGDGHENRVLRRQLIQAGFYDQKAVAYYFAARVGVAAVLAVAGLLVLPLAFDQMGSSTVWMWTAILALVGYLTPSYYLGRRIKQRAAQHREGFPDFMDLMVVCAEAGLSMEAAIDRIAREMVEGHPSLAENLYMACLEIRAGKAFPEALERLGERLGIEEASMLATLLQQSAELGTSLSQSLRVYSDEMRNKRMSRAEEKAYALPAKLVVPLTLFVFPVLIITLMVPAVVRMMVAFSGG
ncbi:MAG TPA: type II secretion system F family protein [Beijerinckiaceae bacterium]|nr:type II secretion system F family protein [Beijerinckiaceae bacterium]